MQEGKKKVFFRGDNGWISSKHLVDDNKGINGIIVNKDTILKPSVQYFYTSYNDDFENITLTKKNKSDDWVKELQSSQILPESEFVEKFKLDANGLRVKDQANPFEYRTITYTPEEIEKRIANTPDYNIDKNTEHLTNYFLNHGDKNRKFCNGWQTKGNQLVDGYLLKTHFKRLKTEDLMRLKSFYFKCLACYGAYYDGHTTIFDEIQKKLKEIPNNMNKPKCFVRLLKKEYSGHIEIETNTKTNKERFKSLPLKHGGGFINLDDVYENPDNYFDYYYVTKDAIYKVPHELVHNRVKLIDEGKFDKEFQKTQNIDITQDCQDDCKVRTREIDPKVEFKEFYDYKQTRSAQSSIDLQVNTTQHNFNLSSSAF